MNSLYDQELLDNILDAYVTEVETPNLEVLKEWIRKYPQYQRELTDFTIAWIQMEELPPINRNKTDHDTLVLRAMSVVQNLHRIGEQKSVPSQSAKNPIEKLVAEAETQGFSQDQFAAQLKLSVGLLWKLDRRLIKYSSIPVELIENIAGTLRRGLQIVAEYFQRPPTLATNARYKAKQQPQVSEPTNFFDEVRSDTELSNENRAYWLELEPSNG
jgi:transcriptional regulator with XRE-family HTH domain